MKNDKLGKLLVRILVQAKLIIAVFFKISSLSHQALKTSSVADEWSSASILNEC